MSHRKPDSQLDASVIHLIHRARQCADVVLQNRSLELDLTPTQILILAAVSANAGLSQTELCEATGIDRSTTADVVRRMVNKGLLRRVRTKKDARTYALNLTVQGHQAMSAAAPAAAGAGEELLAVLPVEHRERFIESLHTVIDRLVSQKPRVQREPSLSDDKRRAVSGRQLVGDVIGK